MRISVGIIVADNILMPEQSPEASQAGSSMKLSECAVPWIYFFLAEGYIILSLFFSLTVSKLYLTVKLNK